MGCGGGGTSVPDYLSEIVRNKELIVERKGARLPSSAIRDLTFNDLLEETTRVTILGDAFYLQKGSDNKISEIGISKLPSGRRVILDANSSLEGNLLACPILEAMHRAYKASKENIIYN